METQRERAQLKLEDSYRKHRMKATQISSKTKWNVQVTRTTFTLQLMTLGSHEISLRAQANVHDMRIEKWPAVFHVMRCSQ